MGNRGRVRANSHLKAAEYSIPVLGLIFLKFADSRFTTLEGELKGKATGRREIGKTDYQAKGVLYLPEQARFSQLLILKESDTLGKAINDAMAAIEDENPQLRGVLPRTYQELSNSTLVSLLRSVNAILGNIEGDAFGKVIQRDEPQHDRSQTPRDRQIHSPAPKCGDGSNSRARPSASFLTLSLFARNTSVPLHLHCNVGLNASGSSAFAPIA